MVIANLQSDIEHEQIMVPDIGANLIISPPRLLGGVTVQFLTAKGLSKDMHCIMEVFHSNEEAECNILPQ